MRVLTRVAQAFRLNAVALAHTVNDENIVLIWLHIIRSNYNSPHTRFLSSSTTSRNPATGSADVLLVDHTAHESRSLDSPRFMRGYYLVILSKFKCFLCHVAL